MRTQHTGCALLHYTHSLAAAINTKPWRNQPKYSHQWNPSIAPNTKVTILLFTSNRLPRLLFLLYGKMAIGEHFVNSQCKTQKTPEWIKLSWCTLCLPWPTSEGILHLGVSAVLNPPFTVYVPLSITTLCPITPSWTNRHQHRWQSRGKTAKSVWRVSPAVAACCLAVRLHDALLLPVAPLGRRRRLLICWSVKSFYISLLSRLIGYIDWKCLFCLILNLCGELHP